MTVDDDLRARLQAEVPELAPVVVETLAEAMRATKRARITDPCPKCGCQHSRWVDIPDAVAATNAVRMFVEHTAGRPGQAETTQAQTVIVRRVAGIDTPTAGADPGETP